MLVGIDFEFTNLTPTPSTWEQDNIAAAGAVDRELGGRGYIGYFFDVYDFFLEISGICEKVAQLAGSRKSAFQKKSV